MAAPKVLTSQERKVQIVRVFQFIIYAWAMRLSFVAIGSVLVAVFQLFVPASTIGIKLQHIPVFIWADVVNDEYRVIQSLKEPALFTGVSVITPALLRSKIERVTPIMSTKLKSSQSNKFVHYDMGRLWSTKYAHEKDYDYISVQDYLFSSVKGKFHQYGLLDHLRKDTHPITGGGNTENTCANSLCKPIENTQTIAGDIQHTRRYIYGTHSNALQYLPALAPGFAQYLSLEDSTPQVCMWVSSPNVTAALHYDLEDNFLLQISGTKTVILVSPEALPALRPHTSWHPHWRQVANSSELHTSGQIIDYLHAFADAFSAAAAAVESRNDSRTPPSRLRTFSAYGEMKVYELTLLPGSMVHIPAGYYHTIVAGEDSLSVNAWFPSDLSAHHTQIINIALPFTKANTIGTKINSLTVMIRKLLYRLDAVGLSIQLFAESFSHRFEDLPAVEWAISEVDLLCIPSEIKEIESSLSGDSSIARSVDLLYDALIAHKKLGPALLTTTLMDYLEEVLQIVWGSANVSPVLAYDFATQCLGLV